MLDIREIPSHVHLPFVVFLFITSQTLRMVALLPIVLELLVMLGSFDFGALMVGAGSLDEGSAPPVGRGSPEAMPIVAKRDGGRRLFDVAMVLDAVGIFTGGALLSDDAVGFSNLDLSVPLDGFVCTGWEGMDISRGEWGGSVAFVRRPRTLVSLLFIPSIGRIPCSGLQNTFALRSAGISPGGGRRTPVSIGLWIEVEGTVNDTCSSALLPADEPALDREVVLSCALGRFTMRSACTGAAGTGAVNASETLGGVTDCNAGEGIGDKGADTFSGSETSASGATTMGGRGEGDDNFIPGERLLRLVVSLTATGGAFAAAAGGDGCGVGLDPNCGAGEPVSVATVLVASFSLIRFARASIISSSACMSKSSVSITKASPPKNEILSFRRSKDASGQFSWRLNEDWRSTEFRRGLKDGEDVVCARARKRGRAVEAVNVSCEGDDWV